MSRYNDSLEYHASGRPGKIEVITSKPCDTDRDLSLAYSPGVAQPCIEIAKDPKKVFDYTAKGNLVAVITNGTAVLGLGNIGPLAGKPVMEGKGVLFKKFADIDVFDIELNANSAEEVIQAVRALEPTFGGINLEDIKAPECFIIEDELKKTMKIPIFHDDQHGTAIITSAALINAIQIAGKKIEKVKVVVNGAGAAAHACSKLFVHLGLKKENLILCDSKGVIYKGRTDGMNQWKEEFANDTKKRTLTEALDGADVFLGLSVARSVTGAMLKKMNDRPIVFACANPDPEIMPDEAIAARPDVIMATGRSDFPNQVNNVLGFPFIFRGALDVRATQINEAMKLAAVHAIAKLAREEVPESVSRAYGGKQFKFGPDYFIPKPFDPRVLLSVAPAVAKAAMDSGVAQMPITDFEVYHDKLEALQGAAKSFIRTAINKVKTSAKKSQMDLPKIGFTEAHSEKVLKACNIILEEGIARPVLYGYPDMVKKKINSLGLTQLHDVEIYRPSQHPNLNLYAQTLYDMRKRKGVNLPEAIRLMADPNYFGTMAVHLGDLDAVVNGATQNYATSVKPILEIIGKTKAGVASGLIIVVLKDKVLFFSDCTLNVNPSAEDLASIAIDAAEVAQYFEIEPRIAMLSYSNFTGKHESPMKMKRAAELVKDRFPHIIVDGEMQADTAVDPSIINEQFSFSELKKGANILLFPDLSSGNIAYKLLQRLGNAEILGPFLMGLRKPAHTLQRSCSVNDIVNTVALTALQTQVIREMKARR
jgi:malate dehydrogenase (oxaloacetate-decarboxylating)(NADP+)